MPIVISRKGEILQAPALSQDQKDKAWEALTRGWAKTHPDVLKQLKEEAITSKAAS